MPLRVISQCSDTKHGTYARARKSIGEGKLMSKGIVAKRGHVESYF